MKCSLSLYGMKYANIISSFNLFCYIFSIIFALSFFHRKKKLIWFVIYHQYLQPMQVLSILLRKKSCNTKRLIFRVFATVKRSYSGNSSNLRIVIMSWSSLWSCKVCITSCAISQCYSPTIRSWSWRWI